MTSAEVMFTRGKGFGDGADGGDGEGVAESGVLRWEVKGSKGMAAVWMHRMELIQVVGTDSEAVVRCEVLKLQISYIRHSY